jgi:hypothetical protein
VPNGAVLAHHKDFKPAILVCPDRQAVGCPNLSWRAPETLPRAPKGWFIHLPGMPEGAIVTQGEDCEWVCPIERGLEPGQSNFRLWLWLLVPARMSPNDPGRPLAPARLPSMTTRFVAGREDLKVAVCILLHEWFGTIAILWWVGTINEVPGFAEAVPVAPSGIGRHLPDVPKRVVSPHEAFLATIFMASHREAIRRPDSNGRLAPCPPIAPTAVRGCLPDLPDVAITPDGTDFLSAILISPDGEWVGSGRISGRCAQGFPCAPTVIRGPLPCVPEGIIVTYRKDLLAAVSITADAVRFVADV